MAEIPITKAQIFLNFFTIKIITQKLVTYGESKLTASVQVSHRARRSTGCARYAQPFRLPAASQAVGSLRVVLATLV
jgi:hypothetical protein